MEYTQDRIVRPPGTVTGTLSPPTAKNYKCLFVEGTIQLAGYDADLNIVFPGGQKAVLQWRVDGPTLDLCFDQPIEVFNETEDMEPAPANQSRPEHHLGVVQLVIPLPREYAAQLPYSVGLADVNGSMLRRFATEEEANTFIGTLIDNSGGRYYLDGPEENTEPKEAKHEQN